MPGAYAGGKLSALPVSLNEMLLRGCTLKNSNRVLGLVVYTGPDSRIQMNAAAPPRKTGGLLDDLSACRASSIS